MSEHISVFPTTWCCDRPDPETGFDATCRSVEAHYHADCDRCRYNPDTCADCRSGECQRLHPIERVWGATPGQVRELMREHWAADHEPQDLLELLGSMT